MIDVEPHGEEGTAEHEAALQLRDLIAKEWPLAARDNQHHIKIISDAKCHGQRTVDVDIVVFLSIQLPRPTGVYEENGREIYLSHVCMTVEVKDVGPDMVEYKGNSVYVGYRNSNKKKNASSQAFGQQNSLFNFLNDAGVRAPYVAHLIWLRNVPESHLPQVRHNVVGSNPNWATFVQRIGESASHHWNKKHQRMIVGKGNPTQSDVEIAAHALTKPVDSASPLERSRMEAITLDAAKGEGYFDELGKKLLIFRGRGGTGKTVQLLQLAHQLYQGSDSNVLVLTYNNALAADLRRLLTLMGINQGYADRNISIQTVHSYMGQIFSRSDAFEEEELDHLLAHYDEYKGRLLSYIREEAISEKDLEKMLEDYPESFDWDYLMIDEAQDWPDDEREILFTLYDHKRFVLADGQEQLVRSSAPIKWHRGIPDSEKKIVSYSQSKRLKTNLCRFVNPFASRMELANWEVETNAELWGGRLIVVEGPYSQVPQLHKQLLEDHTKQGNEPIDMLVCIPPKYARKATRSGKSIVAERFMEWGWQVWDGSVEEERRQAPEQLDQLRVVQYDSCRGLEGWTVVNIGFDKFYDYKVARWKKEIGQSNTYATLEQQAREYAARWLMIPLTRAIDTLVIQVSSSDHPVVEELRAVAKERCADFVEWHTAG